jgi:cytochrome c oxidase subunit IV
MAAVVPRRVYYRVYAALLGLALLTWGLSYVHLGDPLSVIVALTIAISKALLVVLFFMHVRYSSRLTWVVVSAGVFWLLVLLVFTLSDYLMRRTVAGC